ncbi:hypothetical protein D9758_012868 [Tetrapyrgos nigripes]|uniref:Zn(2)-C6 fungal-type domain-containing protein n=1 Tax=Tetrapyrgos nigripes TaxID=182062 RepID=A0A8H5CBT0_9AGAR|nr:hypothetical protein D9758_012868 [Tetrapyrgos nigripes]
MGSHSQPIKSRGHLAQKKACLGCRSIKVRCDRAEPDKVNSSIQCTRCARLQIPCVVQEHHRGRRTAPGARETFSAMNQDDDMLVDVGQSSHRVPSQETTQSRPPSSVNSSSSSSYTPPSYSDLCNNTTETDSAHRDYLRAPLAETLNRQQTTLPSPGLGQDPVSVRYLTVSEAKSLLLFYMTEMNQIYALLDPILCTFEYVRAKSPLLFTAILTVAAKFEMQGKYPILLTFCQDLLAKTFIVGTSSLETIQAIRILISYRDHTDHSSYVKLGFCIRMAYDLSLDQPHKRPLPDDETRAREILSGERTWFELVSTDEAISRQRGRPVIISSESVQDPRRWVEENAKYRLDTDPFIAAQTSACGQEYGTFSKLFAIDPPSFSSFAQRQELQLAAARRAKQWTEIWSRPSQEDYRFPIHPTCLATLHFFRCMLDFHVAEIYYRHVLYRPEGVNDLGKEFPALVAVYGAAIAMFQLFSDEFGDGSLRYAPDYMLIGSAHVALWLYKNRSKMHDTTKMAVLTVLKGAMQQFCSSAKADHEGAAYQARFLDGLIHAIEMENGQGSSPCSGSEITAANTNDPHIPVRQVRQMPEQQSHDVPLNPDFPSSVAASMHTYSYPAPPAQEYNIPVDDSFNFLFQDTQAPQAAGFSSLFNIVPDSSYWANLFPELSQ